MAKEFFKNIFGKNDSGEKKAPKATAQNSSSGSDLGSIFQKWSKNHSDSPQNDLAVQLLQKQIENYEKEIEKRRQRLLEEMRPKCTAVVGMKRVKSMLQDTDDALPYKPILLDINKVLADIKTKRAAQLAAQSGQPLPIAAKTKSATLAQKKLGSKSISAKSKATSARTTKSAGTSIRTTKPTPAPSQTKPQSSDSSTSSATSTAQSIADSASDNAIEANVQSNPTQVAASQKVETSKKVETSSAGSSSSEDSGSANEKQQGFAGILMAMIEEAEKPPEQKPKESEKKLTGVELAAMSRNEPQRFDLLVLEHTKQCIFVTQPTSEETRNWNDKRARSEMKQRNDEVTFNSKQPLESRTFCITCKPRYPFPN